MSLEHQLLSEQDSLQSLSLLWAKKYVHQVQHKPSALTVLSEAERRTEIAQELLQLLRPTSVQAWTKTEALLSEEVMRHGIEPDLINPWEVSKDAHYIYEKALKAYADGLTPERLSVLISADIGDIRQRHTQADPRVLGFVSMQFHYSGQALLRVLPSDRQPALTAYFKVIDDHLYMPLQRAYGAAAKRDYQEPQLETVRQLLPASSEIARKIVARVMNLYPSYECHTGRLNHPAVQISSLRDVEMFQVYLWVCVLEGNVNAIQQELFPLCVMLYPTLQVNWVLVRQLIHLLGGEIEARLEPRLAKYYKPYYQALWTMFSPEVFPEAG